MAHVIKTGKIPAGGRWKIVLDNIEPSKFDQIIQWTGRSLSGTVWWSCTYFKKSDSKSPIYLPARHYQKKWDDEVPTWTFWFSSQADAALFTLWWKKW